MILKAIGDISFARRIEGFVRKHGDDYPWASVQTSLDGADILFGNLESVMIPPNFPQDQTNDHFQALTSDDSMTSSLQAGGFDVINLAANHILDCGWPEIIAHNPDELIENLGWHWIHDFPQLANGLKDMAEVKYRQHAGNDFEWARPFSPFE